MREQMWRDIRAKSETMAKRLMRDPLVFGSNVKNPVARRVAVKLYRLAQKLYRFN